MAANMIYLRGQTWRLRPKKEVFAVREIIAIEAKVHPRQEVFHQAMENYWFASRSYVLVKNRRSNETAIQAASSLPVGVWVTGEPSPIVKVRKPQRQQPVSYASWLFNEWVWRLDTNTIVGRT
jgi:hypothetical protein